MKKIITITGIFLFSFSSYAQEKVYFPFFEVLNTHYGYQYSTSRLFKTYVDNNNKYTIILPEKPDSIYRTESFEQMKQNARHNNAKYFLTGELNAMNEVMIISMSLYAAEDGHKVWSDMLKARTPDDLDPILLRLSKSLGATTSAAEAGDIYSVSNYESRELEKINSNNNFGIFVGGTNTFYPGLSNTFSGGFGISFSYDVRDLILNVNGEAYFGDVDLYNFNLTTLYPFKKTRNTPFVGAGLGYGGTDISLKQEGVDYTGTKYAFTETHHNGGLLFFLRGGYIFNRTAKAHVQAGASLCIPTYEIDSKLPACVMINLAFLF